jgi:uncharacterized protein (TIGR02391 family)
MSSEKKLIKDFREPEVFLALKRMCLYIVEEWGTDLLSDEEVEAEYKLVIARSKRHKGELVKLSKLDADLSWGSEKQNIAKNNFATVHIGDFNPWYDGPLTLRELLDSIESFVDFMSFSEPKYIREAEFEHFYAYLKNIESKSTSESQYTFVDVTNDQISIKIRDEIYQHIGIYMETEDYFHAVEEAYKVVRHKLLGITTKEKATDIFSMNAESKKYHKAIFGKTVIADSPEEDFFRGVGYLNLAIQFLRNEKSHSLATTLDKNLALHYISLASLAYDLITKAEATA